VLANVAWTPPTLAGTTLYVRDRKNIAAFALGTEQRSTLNVQDSVRQAR
jgi:hypothetical protein